MRLRHPVEERVLPAPTGMSAQQFMQDAGPYPRVVSVDQPAPADMPFRLEVLGVLADGAESVYTMRNCGDMKPYGLALVGENALLSILRDLLGEGLIEVESEYVIVDGQLIERAPRLPPATSAEDLQRYWFVMTRAGWGVWEAGGDQVRAYHIAHPLEQDR